MLAEINSKNYLHRESERKDILPAQIWTDESKSEISLGSTYHDFVNWNVSEWFLHVWVPLWSMEDELCW